MQLVGIKQRQRPVITVLIGMDRHKNFRVEREYPSDSGDRARRIERQVRGFVQVFHQSNSFALSVGRNHHVQTRYLQVRFMQEQLSFEFDTANVLGCQVVNQPADVMRAHADTERAAATQNEVALGKPSTGRLQYLYQRISQLYGNSLGVECLDLIGCDHSAIEQPTPLVCHGLRVAGGQLDAIDSNQHVSISPYRCAWECRSTRN